MKRGNYKPLCTWWLGSSGFQAAFQILECRAERGNEWDDIGNV